MTKPRHPSKTLGARPWRALFCAAPAEFLTIVAAPPRVTPAPVAVMEGRRGTNDPINQN
jgi:hypothetical protein